MNDENILNEIKRRQSIYIRLQNCKQLIAAIKVHYKHNPIDFINDWITTYDPWIENKIIPMVLFDIQKKYIRWLIEMEKGKKFAIVEKSRDVGVTWLCVVYAIWRWLFWDNYKIGFGSRKEDLVDLKGNMDSIFEKIRYALRYIPDIFLLNYDENEHGTYMKIRNVTNGSCIVGEAGENIGRGGRNSIYFVDESAFIQNQLKVESALSLNTECKIDVSTPNGNGNLFAKNRHSGKRPVFTFHWKDDPRKDQKWYEDQKAKLDSVIIAQEIDIDYNASQENTCIPNKWIRSATNIKLKKSGWKKSSLDVADETGQDRNVQILGYGVVIEKIYSWDGIDTTQTARKAYENSRIYGADVFNYDCIGIGAGIRGEMNSLYDKNMQIVAVNVANSPTDEFYDNSDRKNSEMFLNLRSQLWWTLRRRFEKTYEHTNNIKKYKEDELIQIPNDNELINELSMPKYMFAENGKIKIESKEHMRRRGVKSPNKADALIMFFHIEKTYKNYYFKY